MTFTDLSQCAEEVPGGLKISVRVQPGASKNEIGKIRQGFLRLKLTAPPVQGSANKQLVAFLSKKLHISKSGIELLTGEKGRQKRLFLRGITIRDLKEMITVASGKRGR